MSMDNAFPRKAYFLTESTVSTETSIDSLLRFMHVQRMTAHVSIQLIQGGIRAVTVTEKKEVEPSSP